MSEYVWTVSPLLGKPNQWRSAGVRLVCPRRHPLAVVHRGADLGMGVLSATLALTHAAVLNLDEGAGLMQWRCAKCPTSKPGLVSLPKIERRLDRLARDDSFDDFVLG